MSLEDRLVLFAQAVGTDIKSLLGGSRVYVIPEGSTPEAEGVPPGSVIYYLGQPTTPVDPEPEPEPDDGTWAGNPAVIAQSYDGSENKTNPAKSTTLTFANKPKVGRLLTAVLGIDKNAQGIVTVPNGWELMGPGRFQTSVSQVALYRIADGSSLDMSVTIDLTVTVNGLRKALTEWSFKPSGPPIVSVSPQSETAVTSVALDGGVATGREFAMAFGSLDSGAGLNGVWDNGYTKAFDFAGVGNSATSDDNGGACISAATKSLLAGDGANVTFSSNISDQTTLRIARFPGQAF